MLLAFLFDILSSLAGGVRVQEAYHEMLVKYREELTRPLQEAMEFLRRVETQLNTLSISGRSLRNILSSGNTTHPSILPSSSIHVLIHCMSSSSIDLLVYITVSSALFLLSLLSI